MKEYLDWEKCKQEMLAKRINPDKDMAASLIESARDRKATVALLPLNETTKETVISLHYDILREILEALSIVNGYKIYNHECYTYFLKKILNDEESSQEFDSLRKLRNGINYYGKHVILEDAKQAIESCENILRKIEKILKENM